MWTHTALGFLGGAAEFHVPTCYPSGGRARWLLVAAKTECVGGWGCHQGHRPRLLPCCDPLPAACCEPWTLRAAEDTGRSNRGPGSVGGTDATTLWLRERAIWGDTRLFLLSEV